MAPEPPEPEHVQIFRIPLAEARIKCSEQNSCFVRVESTEHICFGPRFLGRLKEGVREELNNKLMKYSHVLEGVPVCVEGFKILQRRGSILEELPKIHFDVKVNLIVFKPSIGSTLTGVVNSIGVDHVGCLVHNSFNASISDFRNGFVFDSLDIGSQFTFKVIGLPVANDVLAINGEAGEHRKQRKRKHKDAEEARNHADVESGLSESVVEVQIEKLNCVNEMNGDIRTKSVKKKKKKEKRHERKNDKEKQK